MQHTHFLIFVFLLQCTTINAVWLALIGNWNVAFIRKGKRCSETWSTLFELLIFQFQDLFMMNSTGMWWIGLQISLSCRFEKDWIKNASSDNNILKLFYPSWAVDLSGFRTTLLYAYSTSPPAAAKDDIYGNDTMWRPNWNAAKKPYMSLTGSLIWLQMKNKGCKKLNLHVHPNK